MSTPLRSDLIKEFKKDVCEALNPLRRSWDKLKEKPIPLILDKEKNLDELEPWEALTSRFARVTDIFLSKFIRLKVLELDPGFRGEMRDLLDKAEKTGLVTNADQWMKIRELRNKISHEYTTEDLRKTFEDIIKLTPFVLEELKEFKS